MPVNLGDVAQNSSSIPTTNCSGSRLKMACTSSRPSMGSRKSGVATANNQGPAMVYTSTGIE